MPDPRKVIVTGAIAAHPIGGGGNTWAFLQYVLGLRELGFDVAYFEEIDHSRCFDEHWQPTDFASCWNARYLLEVAERFGFGDRVMLLCSDGRTAGMTCSAAIRFAQDSELLVLLSGRFHQREILSSVKRRLYVDLDPGFTQIWHQQYRVDMNLSGHDAYCTVGLNLGATDCTVPLCGIQWHTTLPPVVLDHWSVAPRPGNTWTTVADWRGYSPVEWESQWYGQKRDEFLRVLQLPQRVNLRLELCLAIHPSEPDLPRLREHGWQLASPVPHCAGPDAYHDYVCQSRGEFSVAKHGYVLGRTGWFSDRSACYLAAGLPVVVQDTGFSRYLPVGEGLLAFRTLEEAQQALLAVESHYERHRAAARRLAEEHFASQIVLPRLLRLVGL